MLATVSLLLAVGCGRSYEERLNLTIERMKYEKELDKNLMPPPTKDEGKFRDTIFIRPPRNFKHSKEFTLTVLEPGKFDLDSSFLDEKTANEGLHVLGRIKTIKAPDKKKAAPAADSGSRGDFNSDVVAVLNSAYSIELDLTKFKEETTKKSGNKFLHRSAESGGKNVQVYLFGKKADQFQVALIFEYPKDDQVAMTQKIGYCLESFAVGKKAQKAYAGGSEAEDESGEGGSGGGGVAF